MDKNILKDFFCQVCDLQFDKKSVYNIHLTFVHGKNNTINDKSLYGEKIFRDKDENLTSMNKKSKTHILTNDKVSDHERKNHKCATCGDRFIHSLGP